jgi:putative acetyltransferase
MSCACGHHHPLPHQSHDLASQAIPLTRPMIALSGRLICADGAQMVLALSLMSDHVALSREEPGCLRFDLWQDQDPSVWNLSELFRDADAFAVHQQRTRTSVWGQESGAIERDFTKTEVLPRIRPERPSDHNFIDALNQTACAGPTEARLIRDLRDQGDLELSLVAEAQGTILGHIALSPITGDRPALALAPLSVHPKAQRLGIGAALVEAAIAAAGDTPVVVLGDPAYYGRFGFAPVTLKSPYDGPYLQVHGDLPAGSTIHHARAFAAL